MIIETSISSTRDATVGNDETLRDSARFLGVDAFDNQIVMIFIPQSKAKSLRCSPGLSSGNAFRCAGIDRSNPLHCERHAISMGIMEMKPLKA